MLSIFSSLIKQGKLFFSNAPALYFHNSAFILSNLVRVTHAAHPTMSVNMILLYVLYSCISKWDDVDGGRGARNIDHAWIFKLVVLHQFH